MSYGISCRDVRGTMIVRFRTSFGWLWKTVKIIAELMSNNGYKETIEEMGDLFF